MSSLAEVLHTGIPTSLWSRHGLTPGLPDIAQTSRHGLGNTGGRKKPANSAKSLIAYVKQGSRRGGTDIFQWWLKEQMSSPRVNIRPISSGIYGICQ